ncbi:hypothetical protein B0H10DRAFT_1941602 [Mycena sp. CBHHK59/15]|nr:hypothetical protein B0H10DRAFT_1941602 [Mycena sp. CBHHK59/15]
MDAERTHRHRYYPWPWGQPDLLTAQARIAEEERLRASYWIDTDYSRSENSSDDGSDYTPSEDSETDEQSEVSDNAQQDSEGLDEMELTDLREDAVSGWPPSPTPSEKQRAENEDLARQVAELVRAEQDASAAYNPGEIVSLITQFYELMVTMGHWPEGSIRYAPHTNPPVNSDLATQLGYSPAVISLMQKLPYLVSLCNQQKHYIIARTRFANYTGEKDLKEGRHPYPYLYTDGCPDLDPWLLPLTLPNRDGWNVILDTNIGVIRAYCTERSPSHQSIEWRRHGEVNTEAEEAAQWTEYRRAPLVPAARYLTEVIDAYRSLERLPIIDPDKSDRKKETHPGYRFVTNETREEWAALMGLYQECGWPDHWQREVFLRRWDIKKQEIIERARARAPGGRSQETTP